MVDGLATAGLGKPDYKKARVQHANYIKALEKCGLEVLVLEADEQFPDSTFVEDVALLTSKFAVITNPGAPSRNGEIVEMKKILNNFYSETEEISEPGKVEAGDIMRVDSHFYIGLSARTNENGVQQMFEILKKYGMSGSAVSLEKVLHLKTGVSYLEKNNLVACGEFILKKEFSKFNILEIEQNESYAANCIWVNENILIPAGFPKAKKTIIKAGYKILEVDVSEFQKLDGGLSCLSLRF